MPDVSQGLGVLATTYSEDAQRCITMAGITAAGLVPMAALFGQA